MTQQTPPLRVKKFFSTCSCGQDGPHDHARPFSALRVTSPSEESPPVLKSADELRADAVTNALAESFSFKFPS